MQRHRPAIDRARIRLSNNPARRSLDLAAGPVPGILKFRQAAGGAFNRAHRAIQDWEQSDGTGMRCLRERPAVRQ